MNEIVKRKDILSC